VAEAMQFRLGLFDDHQQPIRFSILKGLVVIID